jgi:hypothetical protein
LDLQGATYSSCFFLFGLFFEFTSSEFCACCALVLYEHIVVQNEGIIAGYMFDSLPVLNKVIAIVVERF